QALVLISPDTSTAGLFATKAAATLRPYPVAVLIGTSEKNTHDLSMAKKLSEQLAPKKDKEKEERILFKKYPENVRGMDLVLQDKQLKTNMFEFLDKFVKKHESAWVDRRSRLERE